MISDLQRPTETLRRKRRGREGEKEEDEEEEEEKEEEGEKEEEKGEGEEKGRKRRRKRRGRKRSRLLLVLLTLSDSSSQAGHMTTAHSSRLFTFTSPVGHGQGWAGSERAWLWPVGVAYLQAAEADHAVHHLGDAEAVAEVVEGVVFVVVVDTELWRQSQLITRPQEGGAEAAGAWPHQPSLQGDGVDAEVLDQAQVVVHVLQAAQHLQASVHRLHLLHPLHLLHLLQLRMKTFILSFLSYTWTRLSPRWAPTAKHQRWAI